MPQARKYDVCLRHIKFDMTYAKTSSFSPDLQQTANLARALSHPARLAILRYLAACNTFVSGDISDIIPLSRTTVSQHLQELKKAGLIQGEVSGVCVHYCLSGEGVNILKSLLGGFIAELQTNNHNACS